MTANAQLKVSSNGYVGITTTSTPLSPVSLNCNGNSDYYLCYSGDKNGFYCVISDGGFMGGNIGLLPTGTESLFVGLRSRINQPNNIQNNAYNSFGLQGNASYGAYKYGVAGSITTSNNGAAILGVAGSYISSDRPVGCYAGYFKGNVKVKGTFTATNLLTGTPTNLSLTDSHPVTRIGDRNSVTSKLRELRRMTYYLGQTAKSRDVEDTGTPTDMFGSEILADDEELTLLEKQQLSKVHHGIDVKKLVEFYPELVYEMEDGSQAVNYMEMIPLLVQSINELSLELEALRGDDSKERSRATAKVDENNYYNTNRLYQNSPNPFTERTEIRFSLADDAKNAYIYIFDMTGKNLKQIPVDASMQSVTVNGYELSSGIYLYSLVVNGQEIDTKRMILSN